VSNPLKKRIGIIGGGQLGRMMIEESLRLNLQINTLDAADSPCASLSHTHIVGSLMDAEAINQLASVSDVITYEIEHVNTEALIALEDQGYPIIPSPRVLQIIQDKGLQKSFLQQKGIPTAPFSLIYNADDWKIKAEQMGATKFAAKTRKDGYDGKGVMLVSIEQLKSGAIPFKTPSLLEQFVTCSKELSVMVARHTDGTIYAWPVVEMLFDPIANLVTFLQCPAQINESIETQAIDIAMQCIQQLDGYGVFAVELFLTAQNEILVNEIAPRPHNSGHHTIEACYTSQFEQLIRILAGLPLGNTALIQPAIMMNLLGADDFSGTYKLQGIDEAMRMQGVYIHLYSKATSKPMRKMGHVTILATDIAQAHQKALKVQEILKFVKD
jgi:5-(carboxyamino)imidazole ribonucleotide synthase